MSGNQLYPVFLKMDRLKLLVVGGGFVAAEKLRFLHKSSPNANVTIVAKELSAEVKEVAGLLNATIHIRAFEKEDVIPFDLVIAATNDKELNGEVWKAAKANKVLINAADTPELCDFYLGGIVTKGDLKIAISTNGKSPTFAKRLREFFEDLIPNDTDDLLQHLHDYRSQLKSNFEEKVKTMNELTSTLLKK
jgi:precorrin-2 dehydrogenase/sirohydrochlorin ferrochelatase